MPKKTAKLGNGCFHCKILPNNPHYNGLKTATPGSNYLKHHGHGLKKEMKMIPVKP